MTDEQLIAPFTRVPIFSGLLSSQLERIARHAERVVFQPGDLIQREGEPGDAAVLVLSGKVAVVDGTDPAIDAEAVLPGSLLGELAMLIETYYASTIVARSAVRAYRISRHDMRQLMHVDPRLADHFVATIGQRLKRMAAEMRRIDAMIAASPAYASPTGHSHIH